MPLKNKLGMNWPHDVMLILLLQHLSTGSLAVIETDD